MKVRRDRNRRECSQEMVMAVAYESVRATCVAIGVSKLGDATPASDHQPRSRTPPVRGHAGERFSSAGRRQRHDEQHTCKAINHHVQF